MMKTVSSTLISARVSKVAATALVLSVLGAGMVHAADDTAAAPVAPAAAPVVADKKPVTTKGDGMGRIAVVDVPFLINTSKAGKSIRAQLDKQRDAYRVQIEKQEGELQIDEKNLMTQQDTLPKDQFLQKRKEFQDKVTSAQRTVQQRRVAFDKAYGDAMEKLRESIVKIVADVAGKNKISLVLNRQEVVLVEEKMDMTKQILTILDNTVSTIPVNISKE
jgi:Skp family chaperone for outer membrane proteins